MCKDKGFVAVEPDNLDGEYSYVHGFVIWQCVPHPSAAAPLLASCSILPSLHPQHCERAPASCNICLLCQKSS
jgi:hypothetical protein